MHSKYSEGVADLLQEDYAEKVPDQELVSSGPVWYLPHHPVMNPNKPDKTRIVFDCSAVFREKSLNTEVLQGPDLTSLLVGVLLRFQQHPVAVMSDIKSMFHQVRVPPHERDVLRFLWWTTGDLTQQPSVYRMCVHLFGGTWSPSACSFALRRTADDNRDDFSTEAVQAVKHNFYVDDCLLSTEDEEQAIQLTAELRDLVKRGGFNLTKWISNNPRVIESVPVEDRAKEVKGLDLNHDAMPVERALGVSWNIELDCFAYKITPKDKPLTRRGMLSIISSIYDPCGYACPFVLQAKLILQELTAMKLGWDEPIPAVLKERWQQWLADLPVMEGFKVNRCLKPHDFGEVKDFELHHFSDASDKAYGAASYLRMTNVGGQVYSSLVFAKSQVAPLKKITIPRLELMAATLSIHLDQMIRRELDLPIASSVFWTDSTIVLQYVKNDDKRFHTFVANRVAIIRGSSEPQQWRHIESQSNPADDLSRGLTAHKMVKNQRWLEGPDFLHLNEECWPTGPEICTASLENDKEVKHEKAKVFTTSKTEDENRDMVGELLESYSSWFRLKKAIAYLLRIRNFLRSKAGHDISFDRSDMKQPIAVEEMNKAEEAIIRHIQTKHFKDEYAFLQQTTEGSTERSVKKEMKDSPLSRLDPEITEHGLLCVGGRLERSPVSDGIKHPLLLPKKHHVVILLIRNFHEQSGHSGREYVLSLMKEKFWIMGGRNAVNEVLRNCLICKRQSARPGEQKMSDLPTERVTPSKPPFTYVGVDCFGPFYVKLEISLKVINTPAPQYFLTV